MANSLKRTFFPSQCIHLKYYNNYKYMSSNKAIKSFDSPYEYFTTVLSFLKAEQWLYNYPNTDILVNNILNNFLPDWIEVLQNITNSELNNLPFGYINSAWPKSLQKFLLKIDHLKYGIEIYKPSCEVPTLQSHNRLSVKKAHEIVYLAVLIHEHCQKHDISVIVDIGAGLGYLSYLLYEKYNYKILAIEGNKKTYDLAIKNQLKYHSNSKENIKFVHHYITKQSNVEINFHLENTNWNVDNVCIVGLHACADLSVSILDVFYKLDFARALAIMPCCYHRLEMSTRSENQEMFKSFPISKTLIDIYGNLNGSRFLRRPFLRLACQQTGSSWKHMTVEDHVAHSKACVFRSILQIIAEEQNLEVKRLKRKTGKVRCNVYEYISNINSTHKLICPDGSDYVINEDIFATNMLEKWKLYEDKCYLVEILTAFQMSLQSICENIVLLDRVQYLREIGINCDIYKVTDDHISPRCHALVANK